MPELPFNSKERKEIDTSISEWRQGDLALEEKWFTHVADPSKALTPESAQIDPGDEPGLEIVERIMPKVSSLSHNLAMSLDLRPKNL